MDNQKNEQKSNARNLITLLLNKNNNVMKTIFDLHNLISRYWNNINATSYMDELVFNFISLSNEEQVEILSRGLQGAMYHHE